MPRFRNADGQNDVTLFKILPDPPLSNEVARGREKMKGREEKRNERERNERQSMEVCHEFDESLKKLLERKSKLLLFDHCFLSPMLLSNFNLFIIWMTTLKIFPSCSKE